MASLSGILPAKGERHFEYDEERRDESIAVTRFG
jgi:hypothetical protein